MKDLPFLPWNCKRALWCLDEIWKFRPWCRPLNFWQFSLQEIKSKQRILINLSFLCYCSDQLWSDSELINSKNETKSFKIKKEYKYSKDCKESFRTEQPKSYVWLQERQILIMMDIVLIWPISHQMEFSGWLSGAWNYKTYNLSVYGAKSNLKVICFT